MTKQQAINIFKEEILPRISKTDKVAIRCTWLDFTDYLCKDGQITQQQYSTWDNPFSK